MSKSIKLTYDQIDKILIDELKDSYRVLTNEMVTISNLKEIPPHRQEDFDHNKTLRKSVKHVLGNYMNKEQFDKWFESTGVKDD